MERGRGPVGEEGEGQERAMGGRLIPSKHITYLCENVMVKPIKNVQKRKKETQLEVHWKCSSRRSSSLQGISWAKKEKRNMGETC